MYINCSFYDIMKLFNCIWSLILQHWIALNVYIYRHDITDILLKVASNTRTLTLNMYMYVLLFLFILLILQRRQCSLMKKRGNPLYSAYIPSFSSCLDQIWNILFKYWSQFLFGSWRNNLNQVVHTGYARVCTTWFGVISNEPNKKFRSILINYFKFILLWYLKIYYFFQIKSEINLNNPKG